MIYVIDIDGTICHSPDGVYEDSLPRLPRIAHIIRYMITETI